MLVDCDIHVGYETLADLIPYLDAPTRQAVVHAREIHGRYTGELHDFIRARVSEAQSQCAPAEQRRVEAFIATTLRVR